jgi:glycosyltransferase involved in cell wall biosynthesis
MVAACPFPARRGTPIRVERLAEALTRRGHEVHVVAYRDGEPEPAQGFPFRVHRGPGLPWAKVGRPGPTYAKLLLHDPILALMLRRVLARRRFDVLHAHHYEGLLAAFCKPPGRLPAVVYDAHTTLGAELPYYGLGLPRGTRAWAARVLDRHLPGRAAHVVAVSEGVRDALLGAGLPRERVTVVGNGVRVDRFEELSDSVPTTVVYAGNLAAYQRLDLLLEAFAILRRRSSEARLVIASEEDPAPLSPLLRAHGLDGETGLAAPRAVRGAAAAPGRGRGRRQPPHGLPGHAAEGPELHGGGPADRRLRRLGGRAAARGDRARGPERGRRGPG